MTNTSTVDHESTYRVARRFGALILIVAAALLIAWQGQFRAQEARLTARFVAWFTSGRTASAGDVFYFGIGTHAVHGLEITPMCSTAILIAPLLFLAGVLLMLGRISTRRVLFAAIIAIAIVCAANLARYAGASAALQHWGTQGFDVVHEYAGSLFVIIGFVVAILLQLRISVRKARTPR